ncbi:hypothetical protein [Acinetobacter defluvii]|uniref:hypothetical protein n=1 Tax=Acinetobacter defluvii TaxID=1871111 RepID=UPI003AF7CC1E
MMLAFCPILTSAQGFQYQKTKSEFKYYTGQATLTGTYSRNLDPEYVDYIGDAICFYPDKKSAPLIPRPKGDERMAWFCFSNFENAKKTFKLPNTIKKGYCTYEGKATVTIKDYELFFIISEGYDLTRLVSAKNISPAKAVKCESYN